MASPYLHTVSRGSGLLFLLCFMAWLCLPSVEVLGQSPTYRPPPPPRNNSSFELRVRWQIAPDVQVSGVGNIPYAEGTTGENNFLTGEERFIQYDNGSINQDFQTIGGADGSAGILVPSSDALASANFTFAEESQIVQVGGEDAIAFRREATFGDPNLVFEATADNSLGWELNYIQYLNSKRRLGLQVGFSFNGFDSAFNEDVTADKEVMNFVHKIVEAFDEDNEPINADVPRDENGDPTGAPFVGVRTITDDNGDVLKLEWAPVDAEGSTEFIMDGAVVRSELELRSSVYTFRAGPTYSLSLLKERVNFNVGLGVSALYYSGRFGAYEFLLGEDNAVGPARPNTTTESSEWQIGGYVDASAHYNVTERVSLFSGLQFQSGNGYNQANEERSIEVDYSSQVYVHAGLGVKF